MKQLLATKEQLATALVGSIQRTEKFEPYESIPGIGEISTIFIIVALGDIRHFFSQIIKHFFQYQSSKIRKNLYFITLNMIRQQVVSSNHLVAYYYKLKNATFAQKA